MQWFLDKLFWLFGGLIPPMDATPERLYTHRASVAALIVLGYLIFGFHIAWICGLVPNFSGAALASDLVKVKGEFHAEFDTIKSQGDNTQLIIIRGQIKSVLRDKCAALQKGNQDALDSANHDLELLADSFFSLTKREYTEPPCSTVLIKADTP
jgi:hypothetical protein